LKFGGTFTRPYSNRKSDVGPVPLDRAPDPAHRHLQTSPALETIMPAVRSLALSALALALSASAAAAHWSNAHPQRLPACEQALGKAADRFNAKERQYWRPSLAIGATRDIREIATNPWGPYFIPRRFCTAIVATNDGLERRMYYVIAAGTGFAGRGYGVEVCVSGADRNLAYAPDCKIAQP
jgi:hypothetical protein